VPFFHDSQKYVLGERRASQVSLEWEMKRGNSKFSPFQHVQNKAAVQGGCLFGCQRRAEPRFYVARDRCFRKNHQRGRVRGEG
jgi:hypothetical protein